MKTEFAGVVLYTPEPEGFWFGLDTGRAFDFASLSYIDVEVRAQSVP